ncbi:MAG: matrixin family metalloprotease [archaeon]
MKFLDFVVLVMLFALLVAGMYLLWLNFPAEPTAFEDYVANLSLNLPSQSSQFHPNMRYPEREITYFISQNCSRKKSNDFLDAVDFLERETILSFKQSETPEILVTCSNVVAEPDEQGHFVAGEGGPSVIINATKYAVIMLGRIGLYRAETCDTPQVATHELLHALGFDHNNNESSIMYPITSCDQVLDKDIVEEIRRLYSVPSAGDLVIESVVANRAGRYLDFKAVISNYGLKEIQNSTLKVIIKNSVIREFDTGGLDIGTKKSWTITDLRIPGDTPEISLVIETNEEEISESNNVAEISVVRDS